MSKEVILFLKYVLVGGFLFLQSANAHENLFVLNENDDVRAYHAHRLFGFVPRYRAAECRVPVRILIEETEFRSAGGAWHGLHGRTPGQWIMATVRLMTMTRPDRFPDMTWWSGERKHGEQITVFQLRSECSRRFEIVAAIVTELGQSFTGVEMIVLDESHIPEGPVNILETGWLDDDGANPEFRAAKDKAIAACVPEAWLELAGISPLKAIRSDLATPSDHTRDNEVRRRLINQNRFVFGIMAWSLMEDGADRTALYDRLMQIGTRKPSAYMLWEDTFFVSELKDYARYWLDHMARCGD